MIEGSKMMRPPSRIHHANRRNPLTDPAKSKSDFPEAILEDLFTSKGDEVWRYNVVVDGWVWKTLITELVQEDIGVPIAYRDAADGKMQINPRPDALVNADKLYVLVRAGNARQDNEIAELLKLCPKVDGANAAT